MIYVDFKRERRRVKGLVRQAQKSLVDRLIKENRDVSTLWRAMAVVTGGTGRKSQVIPTDLTPDKFNEHFLTIADSLAPSQTDPRVNACTETLIDHCNIGRADSSSLCIPPVAVHEVGKKHNLDAK